MCNLLTKVQRLQEEMVALAYSQRGLPQHCCNVGRGQCHLPAGEGLLTYRGVRRRALQCRLGANPEIISAWKVYSGRGICLLCGVGLRGNRITSVPKP